MILHLSSQQTGGAAVAAMRLHKALITSGTESTFLSGGGCEDQKNSIYVCRKNYERFWQRGLFELGIPCTRRQKWEKVRQRYELPGSAIAGVSSDYRLSTHSLVKQSQILHLHWVTGMFDWADFFQNTKQPIVWTLHDMYPYLGVFHYEGDRDRSNQKSQYFEKILKMQKTKVVRNGSRMVCVSPSNWLSAKAASSEVLGHCEHRVIRNAVDTKVFRPHPKSFARDVFNLPDNNKLLLVVAENLDDYRKGMDIFIESLAKSELDKNWDIVSLGLGVLSVPNRTVHSIGLVHDERVLSLLYSAVDLCVVSSREDNSPNVTLESLCCGTPVIALPSGGVPETIESPRDGLIAEKISSEALAEALNQASVMSFDNKAIRQSAILRFDGSVIAKQYNAIYQNLGLKDI